MKHMWQVSLVLVGACIVVGCSSNLGSKGEDGADGADVDGRRVQLPLAITGPHAVTDSQTPRAAMRLAKSDGRTASLRTAPTTPRLAVTAATAGAARSEITTAGNDASLSTPHEATIPSAAVVRSSLTTSTARSGTARTPGALTHVSRAGSSPTAGATRMSGNPTPAEAAE
jgi:hypothetical protein